jgi:Alternative complex III, ActD subunit
MKMGFKIGIYDEEEKFISSIKSLQEKEFKIHDVFMPYPVHEVLNLLKRKSRLPTAAYFMGLSAILATLAFLYYTAVIDWPLVYGGKPLNSFPSFIVITIVLTILTVTIGSLALFSARTKLFPGRQNTVFDHRATDDKFVIVVNTGKLDKSGADKAENIMKGQGAIEVIDKDFENINA